MRSPLWKDTAIFITWDDYGGFYDHVPPPQVDEFGFGFRVPLLTICPYAKPGYIDSQLGEFSSVLRFIEDNWRLSQLTHRDRDAFNLSYVFDFEQEPREPVVLPHAGRLSGPGVRAAERGRAEPDRAPARRYLPGVSCVFKVWSELSHGPKCRQKSRRGRR